MRDKTEQQILDGFRTLREMSPPESASESAVRRALESVRADTQIPHVRLVRSKRWILRGSIAAGVLLAAGLLWMSQSARPVSAAELLRQVVETADAYRGWVHIVPERDGKLPDPVNGVYPGMHLNKADGTQVATEPGPRILMDVPSRKETTEYDSRTNEIRFGDLIPYNVGAIQRATERLPINVGSQLASFRQITGREPVELTRSPDGEYERIRIRYFQNANEAAAVLKPISSCAGLPVETTLWIDPRTKLIQRGTTTDIFRYADGIRLANEPRSFRMFYGQPIADIYAAGAPRNAKVMDRRVAGDAKRIWDRLEKRHEQAYGDGIALLTSSELLPDGRLDPTGCTLEIYMRQGAAKFFGHYYISSKPGHKGQPRIPPFTDWPTPDLQEVLRRARLARPGMVFVTDGKRAWGGNEDRGRWVEPEKMALWEAIMSISVSGQVWPTRRSLRLYGTGTSADMARDPAHPEWLLIHARQANVKPGPGEATESGLAREVLHWLDTSRDDVPVHQVIREYAKDGRTVGREHEYTYLDWAQLPNGQWCPTQWRQVNRTNAKGSLVVESSLESRLRIFPGAPIDPQWLAMPPAIPSPTSTRPASNGS